MKVFEIFCKFRVFIFTYRAIAENVELVENKIRVIFDWENPWKGIRVSWEIIVRLFSLWRKVIIIYRRFHWFREFRGNDQALSYRRLGTFHTISKINFWNFVKSLNKIQSSNFNIKLVFSSFKIKDYFSNKDPIPDDLKFFLVYKCTCANLVKLVVILKLELGNISKRITSLVFLNIYILQ